MASITELVAKATETLHEQKFSDDFIRKYVAIWRKLQVYAQKYRIDEFSWDLRAAENAQNSKSVYAVHAALGLSVSDVLLQGCKPVIVEGASDQYYFNAIKQYLIGKEKIHPSDELVFIPSGGVKGISQLAALVSAKNGLPHVIVDSDSSGESFSQKLRSNLYSGDEGCKVLSVGEFASVQNAEVEDLIPFDLLQKPIDRLLRNDEDDEFEDEYNPEQPIIPQIEDFAKSHNVVLPHGYKVDIAKQVKQSMLKKKARDVDSSSEAVWITLFEKLLT